jgi:hypothetical protein
MSDVDLHRPDPDKDKLAGGPVIIVRNSRVTAVLLLVLAGGAFFVAGCFGILTLAGFQNFTFNHIFSMLGELVSAYFAWMTGILLGRLALMRWRNTVCLTADGVVFQLGAPKKHPEIRLPWSEITEVVHRRLRKSQSFTVIGVHQRVTFTAMSFGRPKRLAQLIASRAGKTMTETLIGAART